MPVSAPPRPLRLALLVLLLATPRAAAQLRPIDPLPFLPRHPGESFLLGAGIGVHQDQRASLAGTEGRLTELGNLRGVWRTGRVTLEAAGTVLRLFDDRRRFEEPTGGVRSPGPHRRDSGDYSISTTVRVTPEARDLAGTIRFGARLPNSNNRVGIDRDRTDFFGLFGGTLRRGRLDLGAEMGIGIFGSHAEERELEQADVLVFDASAEYRAGPVTATAALLGQDNLHVSWDLRGNEDLSELRLGLRAGTRRWIQVSWVRGLAAFSPSNGVLVSAGVTR